MAATKDPKGLKSDKEWRDAIRLAVHELRTIEDKDGKPQKIKALRLLAIGLVDKALDGDVPAIKEIGDRLDGKPTQQVEATVDGNLTVEIKRFSEKVVS